MGRAIGVFARPHGPRSPACLLALTHARTLSLLPLSLAFALGVLMLALGVALALGPMGSTVHALGISTLLEHLHHLFLHLHHHLHALFVV